MNCKTVTHWQGVLHILRNPYGYSEDIVRQARLDAADRIEWLERELARATDAYENMRTFAQDNGLDTATTNAALTKGDRT